MEYHPDEKRVPFSAMSAQKYEKAVAVRKRWRRGKRNHFNPLNLTKWRSAARQMYLLNLPQLFCKRQRQRSPVMGQVILSSTNEESKERRFLERKTIN